MKSLSTSFQDYLQAAIQAIKSGDYAVTVSNCEEALKLEPQNPGALTLIAMGHEYQENHNEAIKYYKESLAVLPNQYENYEALAKIYSHTDQAFEAIEANKKAIELNPQSHIAWNNLGSNYGRVGDIDEAIECFKKALELSPNTHTLYENLLFYYNCSLKYSQKDAHKLSQKYYQVLKNKFGQEPPEFNPKNYQHEKLRVGFFSADFNHHPVGHFLHSIFDNFDRDQVEIYCYYNGDKQGSMTDIFKKQVDKFRNLNQLSDDLAFETIYKDYPNILIETTGFTNNSRMPLLCRKPAPVMASYLGYFATTGVEEIDHFLLDPHVVKEEEKEFYSENIQAFNQCYMHAQPYGEFPEIKEAAHLKNDYITIGSFSTLRKINDEVISTWSKILEQAPHAKLLLRTSLKNNQEVKQHLEAKFLAQGVSPEQLMIKDFVPREKLFDAYQEVDIALDPFPYGGGVTSVEAMMMGLPMISLYGPIIMSRITASMLHSIGYSELVAKNKEDYIQKTVELINNKDRINEYRQNIRQAMLESDMNIETFTKNFQKTISVIANPRRG